MKPSVTFETKCYEADWEYLLKTGRLKKAISLCRHPFDRTVLIVNNVSDPVKVGQYAERLVRAGVLSSFVFVADHAEQTLSSFECSRESFEKGYYYSISELVAIHLCETDYLLHFSSDSMMASEEDWIEDALAKMETDERVIVANPVWNGKFYAAERESVESDEKFFIGHGFSDQCYLIPVSAFARPIYGETNPESEKNFPAYGGHSFEKRVDAYMRNHGYLRATSKTASYRHKNFSKNKLKKMDPHQVGLKVEGKMNYPVVIHKDKGSDYGVTVPDLPGCFSAGKTLEEALDNVKEAILCHIEGLVNDGEALPEPAPIEQHKENPEYAGGIWAVVSVDLSELSGKAKRVNITVPERFLTQFDSFAHKKGETRSGLFVSAAMEYIARRKAG